LNIKLPKAKGRVIAIPVKFFGTGTVEGVICRYVIQGHRIDEWTDQENKDIQTFCRCALTAAVFDGASMYDSNYNTRLICSLLWVTSIVLVSLGRTG